MSWRGEHMSKKTVHDLKIHHLRYPNEGIAFLNVLQKPNPQNEDLIKEQQVKEIVVQHSLPGQLLEVECTRKRRRITGKILKVKERATQEIETTCPNFGTCGGCTFLNIPYEYELKLKKEMTAQLLKDFYVKEISIVPSPSIEGYRNKMEFSFGDAGKETGLALGIRNRNRYYEVTIPSHCTLITGDFKDIVASTLKYFNQTSETFYHRMRHTGSLRYLILRRGEFTGEILVNIVTTDKVNTLNIEEWKSQLCTLPLEGRLVGVLHTVSNAKSDAVVPEKTRVVYGRDYFFENISDLIFKVSPFSFFQTNSGGAELLYRTVAEFASQGDMIYDLYCGTGGIAQTLASYAKKVIGIELYPESVAAATENASLNKIDNCQFIVGDVLEVMRDHGFTRPDVLILNPPRNGIDTKALDELVTLGAPKIVYVSCKPTTLARDLDLFTKAGYQVEDIRFHDMFPRTPHVETVVLLSKLKATYDEIKEYVLEQTGLKVSQPYIAQVKRKHGIIERENYYTGEGKAKVPQIP